MKLKLLVRRMHCYPVNVDLLRVKINKNQLRFNLCNLHQPNQQQLHLNLTMLLQHGYEMD